MKKLGLLLFVCSLGASAEGWQGTWKLENSQATHRDPTGACAVKLSLGWSRGKIRLVEVPYSSSPSLAASDVQLLSLGKDVVDYGHGKMTFSTTRTRTSLAVKKSFRHKMYSFSNTRTFTPISGGRLQLTVKGTSGLMRRSNKKKHAVNSFCTYRKI